MRVNRVSDEIQKLLAICLKDKIRDPRLKDISITQVELPRDLSLAKVYFSLTNSQNIRDVTKALRAAKGFFRTMLSKYLSLRYIPRLHFIHDVTSSYGAKLDNLISKARLKDQEADS